MAKTPIKVFNERIEIYDAEFGASRHVKIDSSGDVYIQDNTCIDKNEVFVPRDMLGGLIKALTRVQRSKP